MCPVSSNHSKNYKSSDGYEEAIFFGADQTDEIKYQNYRSSEEINPAEARLNEHSGEQCYGSLLVTD